LVSQLLGSAFSDVDANSGRGIAITGSGSSKGVWQYQLSGTSSWATVPAPAKSQVFFLRDTDRLRFVPSVGFRGTVSLPYRGWDGTAGNAGQIASVLSAGTSTSLAMETAFLTVGDANARPVLTVVPTLDLPAVGVNSLTSSGMLISALLGSNVFDANLGTVPGIAVVATDNKNGVWEFSQNGTLWFQIGDTTMTNAVVLRGDYSIRFVPKAGFVGTSSFKFKAWDQSDLTPGGSAIDSTQSTAFGTAIQTAKLAVNTAPTLTIP
jgi:hypothetical protein